MKGIEHVSQQPSTGPATVLVVPVEGQHDRDGLRPVPRFTALRVRENRYSCLSVLLSRGYSTKSLPQALARQCGAWRGKVQAFFLLGLARLGYATVGCLWMSDRSASRSVPCYGGAPAPYIGAPGLIPACCAVEGFPHGDEMVERGAPQLRCPWTRSMVARPAFVAGQPASL